MTDVMTTAFNYPDEPLPGPYHAARQSMIAYGEELDRIPWPPANWADWGRRPAPSPILEPPMYFPGLAWKGTAGMPGRYGEVVYA
jgi:hypothetical protein